MVRSSGTTAEGYWRMNSPEYVGPYRWDEAKERCPNDYRTKDDRPTEYASPPMSKEEFAEYLNERLEDAQCDLIPY